MNNLKESIERCTICAEHLELGVRPVIQFSVDSKIAIIGQAPGLKVHQSGIAWQDASGKRLRTWLGVDDALFYNEEIFALVPLGFCYPGRGRSGDLPPRKECAPQWHDRVFKYLAQIKIIVLVGQYAQNYYLPKNDRNLTERVRHFNEYLPQYFVLPHPSPRNQFWLRKNPWFEKEVLPVLREKIARSIPD